MELRDFCSFLPRKEERERRLEMRQRERRKKVTAALIQTQSCILLCIALHLYWCRHICRVVFIILPQFLNLSYFYPLSLLCIYVDIDVDIGWCRVKAIDVGALHVRHHRLVYMLMSLDICIGVDAEHKP